MKKIKEKLHGLVPEYYPELTKYIEKEFEYEKLKKNYPSLFVQPINKFDQVDIIISIVFSISRQIPPTNKFLNKIKDPFVIWYFYDFIFDCLGDYRDNFFGIVEDDFINEFQDIMKILDNLYNTKDFSKAISKLKDFDKSIPIFRKFGEGLPLTKIQKKTHDASRSASSKDSVKIVNVATKKEHEIFSLSWEKILYGIKDKRLKKTQCDGLSKYFNKK